MKRALLWAALGLAPLGCASIQIGAAGDEPPLTGLSRNVTPLHVQPAWRKPLMLGGFSSSKRHLVAQASTDATGERVLLGPGDGYVYCFSASSGEVLWRDPVPGSVGGAVLDHGRFIFGTSDGLLLAYDAVSGQRLWKYRITGAAHQPPVVSGNVVLFVDGQNALYALDSATGAWKWQYRRKAPDEFALYGEAAPFVADGRAYAGFSDGHLVALDVSTGELIWDRDLAPEHSKFQDIDATPVMVGSRLFAASVASGLHAVNPTTGEVEWTLPFSGVSSLTAIDGDLLVGFESKLARIGTADGQMLWQTNFGDLGAPSVPACGQGVVAISVSQDGLHLLDAMTGRPLSRFRPGNGISAPPTMASDGSIYVFSNGGIFYAFRPPLKTR